MRPKPNGLRPGDMVTRDGQKLAMEEGVLDCSNLSRYSVEELRNCREELYDYAKDRQSSHLAHVSALTLINTELAMREPPAESN